MARPLILVLLAYLWLQPAAALDTQFINVRRSVDEFVLDIQFALPKGLRESQPINCPGKIMHLSASEPREGNIVFRDDQGRTFRLLAGTGTIEYSEIDANGRTWDSEIVADSVLLNINDRYVFSGPPGSIVHLICGPLSDMAVTPEEMYSESYFLTDVDPEGNGPCVLEKYDGDIAHFKCGDGYNPLIGCVGHPEKRRRACFWPHGAFWDSIDKADPGLRDTVGNTIAFTNYAIADRFQLLNDAAARGDPYYRVSREQARVAERRAALEAEAQQQAERSPRTDQKDWTFDPASLSQPPADDVQYRTATEERMSRKRLNTTLWLVALGIDIAMCIYVASQWR